MKVKVRYSVEYEATVFTSYPDQDLNDAIGDIDIPEGGENDSRYKADTFEVLTTTVLDE